jgi:hypothetical protein
MGAEVGAVDEWLDSHTELYETLFDDGKIETHEVNLAPDDLALSALRRITPMSGVRVGEAGRKKKVTQGVQDIIASCFTGQLQTMPDILSDKSAAFLECVARNTGRVISQWDKARIRNGLDSPFADMLTDEFQSGDIESYPTELALMAATALAFVVERRPPKSGEVIPEWATMGILHYGPRFTLDFMLGRNNHQVLGEVGSRTNAKLTPGARNNLLAYSPMTLSISLETIADNLVASSPDKIAEVLGWSHKKTRSIFVPSLTKKLALDRRNIPLTDSVRRIGYLYDEVLTIPKLMKVLEIDNEQAILLRRSAIVKQLVFKSPDADPLDKLQTIFADARILSHDFGISFPLALWATAYIPGKAVQRAELSTSNFLQHPVSFRRSRDEAGSVSCRAHL